MARVAQLGVVIDASGAKQGAADATKALGQIGTAATQSAEAQVRASERAVSASQKQMEATRLTGAEIEKAAKWFDQMYMAETQSTEALDRQTRAMALAEIQAHKMNDAMNQSAGAFNLGGLQVGRIRNELGTLIGRLTGTSTAVDRVAGSFAGMAVGEYEILAILVAVAAVAKGIEYLTEKQRAHSKAIEDSTKALKAYYLEEKNGVSGEVAQQIANAAEKQIALQKKLADAKKDAAAATGLAKDSGKADADVKAIQAHLDEQINIVESGRRKLTSLNQGADREDSKEHDQRLIDLINLGVATTAQIAEANRRAKNLRDQGLADLKDNATQARGIYKLEESDALNKALNPDDSAARAKALREAAKAAAEAMKILQGSDDAVSAAIEGYTKAGLRALANDETRQKLNDAIALQEEKRAKAAEAFLDPLRAQVELIGQTKAVQEQLTDLENYRIGFAKTHNDIEAEAYVRLERALRQNAAAVKEQVDAAKAWDDAFKSIVSAAEQIAGAFGETGRRIASAIGAAQTLYEIMQKVQAADAAAAAARGTSNAASANSAASAAAAGGAVAGGTLVVGLLTGVMAMNKAADEAAKALQALRDAAQASLGNYASQAFGTALDGQLKQIEDGFWSVVKALEAAGGPSLASDLAAANASYFALIAKAKEAAAFAAQQADADLNVRAMVAAGNTEAAAALRLQLAQQKELHDAVLQYGANDPYIAHLTDVQAAETAAAAAAAAEAAATKLLTQQRQSAAFGLDLTARGQSLSGDDRGAVVTRAQISYNSQLNAAEDMVKAGTMSAEMFERLKVILGSEMTKAIDDFDKAAARALQTMKDDLAVRLLVATGDAVGAATLRREIANRKELEGVTDAALIAQIKYVQGIEAVAAAQAAAQAVADTIAAKNQSITQRMISLYETLDPAKAQELKDAQTAIDRAKELADASDDVMRARYRELYALEDQAAALKKMTDSMQALADATKRASDFTTSLSDDFLRATGHSYEADVNQLTTKRDDRLMNARKMGLGQDTIDTINAWFNAAMNNLVKQYMPSPEASAAGGALKAALDPNVQYLTNSVAQSISSQQALGLIDLATSQLVELRKIVANTNGGGNGIRIDVTVQGGMYSGTPGDVGRGIAEAIVPMIDNALGRRVGVDNRLAGNAGFN